jgi:hypothetical protein
MLAPYNGGEARLFRIDIERLLPNSHNDPDIVTGSP